MSGRALALAALLGALPARNVGRFGKPGDPLNLLFLGDETSVRHALQEAGWNEIPVNLGDALRAGASELLHGRPLGALIPMNGYLLDGRVQDENWSRPVTWLTSRHHFRLWRLPGKGPAGVDVWWGAANFDVGLRWWDLSHIPDPDTSAERDYVARSLRGVAGVRSIRLLDAPQVPRSGSNDKGYGFRTDGKVLVVTLGR